MENLRKQKVRAYILLEALVAMMVFAFIATVVLDSISQTRQAQADILGREEVLRVAQMAIQTEQDSLTLNGFRVQVERSDRHLTVYEAGREVLHVEKR